MDLEKAYSVLGLPNNATEREVQQRYRELAIQCHPDHNLGHEAEFNEKMQQINAAYDLIVISMKNGNINTSASARAANTSRRQTREGYINSKYEELSKYLEIKKFEITHEQSPREKEILNSMKEVLENFISRKFNYAFQVDILFNSSLDSTKKYKKQLADEFFESQHITNHELKSRIDYDKPLDDFYEQLYSLKKEYLIEWFREYFEKETKVYRVFILSEDMREKYIEILTSAINKTVEKGCADYKIYEEMHRALETLFGVNIHSKSTREGDTPYRNVSARIYVKKTAAAEVHLSNIDDFYLWDGNEHLESFSSNPYFLNSIYLENPGILGEEYISLNEILNNGERPNAFIKGNMYSLFCIFGDIALLRNLSGESFVSISRISQFTDEDCRKLESCEKRKLTESEKIEIITNIMAAYCSAKEAQKNFSDKYGGRK